MCQDYVLRFHHGGHPQGLLSSTVLLDFSICLHVIVESCFMHKHIGALADARERRRWSTVSAVRELEPVLKRDADGLSAMAVIYSRTLQPA